MEKIRTGCKTPVLVVKAEACYLEHVCIAVMGVLHHHRLGSRQSVRDAVLVFVAYGLMGQTEERVDEYREDKERDKVKASRSSQIELFTSSTRTEPEHAFYSQNTSVICSLVCTENNRYT